MNRKQLLFVFSLQFVAGVVFSQKPETPPVPKEEMSYQVIDEPAEFPGGMSALQEYLKANLKYPESAKEKGSEGRCYLQFVVKISGEISNVEVRRGVAGCPECDKEAVRLVQSMPRWKPGKVNGKPVNSSFTLPITFKSGN